MVVGKAVARYTGPHRDASVARASPHRPQVIGKIVTKSCTACTDATISETAAIVLIDGQCAVQEWSTAREGTDPNVSKIRVCKRNPFCRGALFAEHWGRRFFQVSPGIRYHQVSAVLHVQAVFLGTFSHALLTATIATVLLIIKVSQK